MLCILSPAKTMISAQNIAVKASPIVEATFPFFAEKADILVDILQSKSKKELKEICSVSDAIAIHVKALYDDFRKGETSSNDNARYNQAALMFDGPAFRGLDARSLEPTAAIALQRHLRILTGLYGFVKPGDLIQEHRLCMGTKLKISEGATNLYAFWGDLIAKRLIAELNAQIHEFGSIETKPLVVNCASQEYSKSVIPHLLDHDIRIIECVFYDGGMVKSAFAKRARGLMARFVCTNNITDGSETQVEKIKQFNLEGYQFSQPQSTENTLVFTRSTAAAATAKVASGKKRNSLDAECSHDVSLLSVSLNKKSRNAANENVVPKTLRRRTAGADEAAEELFLKLKPTQNRKRRNK